MIQQTTKEHFLKPSIKTGGEDMKNRVELTALSNTYFAKDN